MLRFPGDVLALFDCGTSLPARDELEAIWRREAPLALATVVLSLIFRGRTLGDPRLPALQRLAWIWSLENGLLAITVYNRLLIYIGFNGMTRMRLVGLFGISCVVVGFALVRKLFR